MEVLSESAHVLSLELGRVVAGGVFNSNLARKNSARVVMELSLELVWVLSLELGGEAHGSAFISDSSRENFAWVVLGFSVGLVELLLVAASSSSLVLSTWVSVFNRLLSLFVQLSLELGLVAGAGLATGSRTVVSH